MSVWYLTSGVVIFALSIALVYGFERRIKVSLAVVFLGFFFHMFLDPWFRIGEDPYLNEAALPTIFVYNLGSYLMLLLGVFFYYLISSGSGYKKNNRPLRYFFSNNSFNISFLILLLAFVVLMASLSLYGRFDGGKGQFSYGGGGAGYRAAIALSYLFYSLVPAMFVSSFLDGNGISKKRLFLSVLCLAMVALYSLSQFGRQTVLFVSVVIVVIYGDRIKQISMKMLGMGVLAFVLINFVSLFRKVGVGANELSLDDVAFLFGSGVVDFSVFAKSIGTIIPGQAVFSNVVDIMEGKSDFFWGRTYFDSLLRVFFPSALVSEFIGPAPAEWYKVTYFSHVKNHGFDFSMVAETYMNFSWFGVMVFFALGIVVAKLSRNISSSGSPIVIIFSGLMIVNIVVGLRNDSNAFLVRAVFFTLPFALVNYLPFFFRRR